MPRVSLSITSTVTLRIATSSNRGSALELEKLIVAFRSPSRPVSSTALTQTVCGPVSPGANVTTTYGAQFTPSSETRTVWSPAFWSASGPSATETLT